MAITPYALQVKSLELPDIQNMLLRRKQMQAAEQQQQVNALAIEDAMTKRQDAQALRNALAQYNPDNPQSVNALMRVPGGADIADSMMKRKQEQQRYEMESKAKTIKLLPKALQNIPDTLEGYSYFYNGATQESPWLKLYLPAPSDFKPGAGGTKEQILVPFKDRYTQNAMNARAQAKLDAEANKPEKPSYQLSTDANGKVTRVNMNTGETFDLGLIGKPSAPAKGDIQSFTDNEGNVTAVNMQTGDKTDLGKIGKGVAGENVKPLTGVQKIKLKNTVATDYKALNSLYQAAEEVYKSAEEAKGHPGLEGATGIQSWAIFPSFPETPFTSGKAAAAETKLENLKGKVTSMGRAVQSMSGAVGSMAVQEWKIMRDSVAALDKAVSSGKKITIEEIENIESFMDGLITRAADTYEKAYGDYFEQYPQELGKFKDLPSLKRSGFGQGGEAAPATRSPSQPSSSNSAPPAGIDAETWQFMTPQERALFEGK